jgi:hypothetical protein
VNFVSGCSGNGKERDGWVEARGGREEKVEEAKTGETYPAHE